MFSDTLSGHTKKPFLSHYHQNPGISRTSSPDALLKLELRNNPKWGGTYTFPPPPRRSELKPLLLLQLAQDYNPVSTSRIPMRFWTIFCIWHVWEPPRTPFWAVVGALVQRWISTGYSANNLEMRLSGPTFRQGCAYPLVLILGRVSKNLVIQNSSKYIFLSPTFFRSPPGGSMFADVRQCSPMFATHGCQLPKPGYTPVEDHQIQIWSFFNVTQHINYVWHAIRHDTSSFQNPTQTLSDRFGLSTLNESWEAP